MWLSIPFSNCIAMHNGVNDTLFYSVLSTCFDTLQRYEYDQLYYKQFYAESCMIMKM